MPSSGATGNPDEQISPLPKTEENARIEGEAERAHNPAFAVDSAFLVTRDPKLLGESGVIEAWGVAFAAFRCG